MEKDTQRNDLIVSGKVSKDFLDIVTQSVTSVFLSICQSEPACIAIGDRILPDDMIVGIMSMVSKELLISFAMGLPRQTVIQVVKKFAHKEILFESSDMADAVAELTNIIAGDIAARLEAFGISARLSIPAVTRGKGVELLLPAMSPFVNVHFNTAFGPFWIKAALGKPNL
jgi:chemotaxis protein CheX